jgi:hypothetical protein
MPRTSTDPTTAAAFWALTRQHPRTGCLLWQGRVVRHARGYIYARVHWAGRVQAAHRVAWLLAHGRLKPTEHVRSCAHAPLCLNPEHLTKGRSGPGLRHGRGELNTYARLTADQVLELHRLRAAGQSLREVSEAFGCSLSTVAAAATGRTWAHLHPSRRQASGQPEGRATDEKKAPV